MTQLYDSAMVVSIMPDNFVVVSFVVVIFVVISFIGLLDFLLDVIVNSWLSLSSCRHKECEILEK